MRSVILGHFGFGYRRLGPAHHQWQHQHQQPGIPCTICIFHCIWETRIICIVVVFVGVCCCFFLLQPIIIIITVACSSRARALWLPRLPRLLHYGVFCFFFGRALLYVFLNWPIFTILNSIRESSKNSSPKKKTVPTRGHYALRYFTFYIHSRIHLHTVYIYRGRNALMLMTMTNPSLKWKRNIFWGGFSCILRFGVCTIFWKGGWTTCECIELGLFALCDDGIAGKGSQRYEFSACNGERWKWGGGGGGPGGIWYMFANNIDDATGWHGRTWYLGHYRRFHRIVEVSSSLFIILEKRCDYK